MIEVLLCVIAALLLLLCVGVWFGAVFLASEAVKRRTGKGAAEEDGEAAQREKEERERQEQAFQAGLHAIMNYSYEDALRGARRE